MILRRLSQSLKEQNWTVIWNEQREDAKAQAYLVRIRGNLERDLQSIAARCSGAK